MVEAFTETPNPVKPEIQSPQNPSSLSPEPAEVPVQSHDFTYPSIRITTELDSENFIFSHKVSCKLFNGLAKLKASFHNGNDGEIRNPQVGFITKYLSLLYDLDSQNALVKASLDVWSRLQFKAEHDVMNGQIVKAKCIHIRCSTKFFSLSCIGNDNESIISCVNLASRFLLKYQHRKAQQGEVTMVTCLADPSYKLELITPYPPIILPRAILKFPVGELQLEEKEEEEPSGALAVSGILKGNLMNGACTAQFTDKDLTLRYSYKDGEMSFIPSISLPSNALSFDFKRRFSPSDKLSYWYDFSSNYWNAVYKHTVGKDLKVKAGYDSAVRLCWASLWVGNETEGAKQAPKKVKVQVMVQVPQDDIKSWTFMFRLKKRWDL